MTHETKIIKGEWLTLAGELAASSIDFLYVDPPFNTGKKQETPPAAGRAGRFVRASYADAWPTTAAYVEWLRQRVSATIPAMKPSATVAVHCDQRTSHRVRVMLEDLLGEDNFVNHLIWSYGLGGSSPRRFARKHDDILVYAIDCRRYYFQPPMVPATSHRLRGTLKKATDVLAIPSLNNMAAERTGYPTQKPLELLRLLVSAFAPAGGTVLDPCCGSGTSLLAARELGRAAIGFDISPAAIRTTRARLKLGG
ncbi:MAG TPA: site-specific DNA-methyltransferase [Phycisphaerales bacterium]|nr:site-specific DNA-methyltransferase [Phycisphaerales bacterium]